jgi:hypothetical protein
MNDDLTPYRWQDHVITPQHGRASLIATALVMIVVGSGVVLAGPQRSDGSGDGRGTPVAQATEREPCLAFLAKPALVLRHMKNRL